MELPRGEAAAAAPESAGATPSSSTAATPERAERADSGDYDSDSETDEQPELTMLDSKPRALGDIRRFCAELLAEQIRLAAEQRVPPNAEMRGDKAARATVALLLSDVLQRELFLEIAREPSNWPRLRPLFGAPPYHFLHASDAVFLRAAGFAAGRVNMAYDVPGICANSSQFGSGQLTDRYARQYRFARDSPASMPGVDGLLGTTGLVHLQVKVRRVSIQARARLARDSDLRKQLLFPAPGERLQLLDSKQLMRLKGIRKPSEATVVVKHVLPRARKGMTASLVVRPV